MKRRILSPESGKKSYIKVKIIEKIKMSEAESKSEPISYSLPDFEMETIP